MDLFKEAVQRVKNHQPFKIQAYVILPEHLHMIWELPPDDSDYSSRWKKIKGLFSTSIQRSGIQLSKTKHNEKTGQVMWKGMIMTLVSENETLITLRCIKATHY